MRALLFILGLATPCLATDWTVTTGADAVVNGQNFQSVLTNNVACGDTVILTAGSTYQGPSVADQAFLLRNKGACAGNYITIRTSNLAGISAEGVRLSPGTQAAAMPKIVADISSFGMPTINVELNANYYKLIGLEITNNGGDGPDYAPNLVNIALQSGSGPGGYPTYAERIGTHDFLVDRCFIHPAELTAANLFPTGDTRTSGRGISLEGVNLTVTNSYIAGFAGKYPVGHPSEGSNIDSYGVFTVVGPGPMLIENNYIEAQFNNIFTGGGDNDTPNTATVSSPALTSATLSNVTNLNVGDLVAFESDTTTVKPWQTAQIATITGNDVTFTIIQGGSQSAPVAPDNGGTARWNGYNVHDITIRRNRLNKPDIWNAFSNPKAWIELKDCVDCLIEANDMYSGVGTTNAFTPRNQNGSAPWAKITNLVFQNNRISGYKWGIGSQGSDNEQVSLSSGDWTIHNNLWINPVPAGGSSDYFLQLGGGTFDGYDNTITHNTILSPNHIAVVQSEITGNFTLKDNIVQNTEYGVQCLLDAADLTACFTGVFTMTNNVIVGAAQASRPHCTDQGSAVYPMGNFCVNAVADVGFVDAANENYRLAPTSQFKNDASDGTDPGVNMDALFSALTGGAEAASGRFMIR